MFSFAWTVISAVVTLSHASSVLTPPVLPLAVRNPYLSTWLQNARNPPWHSWPIFWNRHEIGMSLMASEPTTNTVYPLLGRVQDSLNYDHNIDSFNLSYPKYHGATFDASTTNLTYSIPAPTFDGSFAQLVISFSSPITPTSSMRQSIPASYVTVYVSGDFDLDVYMDVNGDWVSGDVNSRIQWYFQEIESAKSESLYSWQISKEQEAIFTEYDELAEWGKLHFSAPSNVTYRSGSATDVRRSFAIKSSLNNKVEQAFRSIKDDEPVFAFHKSFQLSNPEAQTVNHAEVTFTLAHIQDELVQFASARGLTYMRPLWKSYLESDYKLIAFHYQDRQKATELARNYTSQLHEDSVRAGGIEYADITALSARQVLGAVSFSGTPENPLIFQKEISSNGNTQTVDVIFPAWPFYIYTNPRWLAYLLEPLLEHQLSGQYPNKYSMHDLGAHFPNLTGHADGNDEYMPIEECGDMLIMGLSLVNSLMYNDDTPAQSLWSSVGSNGSTTSLYANDDTTPFYLTIGNATDDSGWLDDQWGGGARGFRQAEKWLKRSSRIWKQWTQYLIDESLEPKNQLCTDDFAGWLPLQTNLALKGIIGIRAMSQLSTILGEDKEARYYKNISTTYMEKWRQYGMTRDGAWAKLAYNWYGSWTTLYSLFSDAILCFHKEKVPASKMEIAAVHDNAQTPLSDTPSLLASNSSNLIDHEIYKRQSSHYDQIIQKYGLPLDSRHLYTKSDWQLQAAAVASPKVKAKIIKSIAKWLNETNTDRPFSDLFDTEGDGGFGAGNLFAARPVVGSHFSILSLERACGGDAWSGYENEAMW